MSEITHYRQIELNLVKIATEPCSGPVKGGCKLWLRKALQTQKDIPACRRRDCAVVLTYIMEWMRPRTGYEDQLYPARYAGQRLTIDRRTVTTELDMDKATYHRVMVALENIRAIGTEYENSGTTISLDPEGFVDLLALGLRKTVLSERSYYADRDKYNNTIHTIRSIYPEVTDAVRLLNVANER